MGRLRHVERKADRLSWVLGLEKWHSGEFPGFPYCFPCIPERMLQQLPYWNYQEAHMQKLPWTLSPLAKGLGRLWRRRTEKCLAISNSNQATMEKKNPALSVVFVKSNEELSFHSKALPHGTVGSQCSDSLTQWCVKDPNKEEYELKCERRNKSTVTVRGFSTPP